SASAALGRRSFFWNRAMTSSSGRQDSLRCQGLVLGYLGAGMRIATFNVNGLRARQDFLLHWLRTREPRLVALQELKLPDEQFPHDVFEQAGYTALVHGQKSWNGVAVLARKPLETVQVGLPGQEAMGARLLCAAVEGLVFASLYCPNGKHTG